MELKRPTLLLNKDTCQKNIERMWAKAHKAGVTFRPHFKTHQSAKVGEWFRDMGVSSITVSSVFMANYFASHQWDDITIAFPVNPAEIIEIDKLAGKIRLNLIIEDAGTMEILQTGLHNECGAFIKVDAGYGRTGVSVNDHQKILCLARQIIDSKNLEFSGLLVHNGHTYKTTHPDQIHKIHNESLLRLQDVKAMLEKNRIPSLLSIGDTPSMSLTENFENVDEIRPGNFVFYDVMQQKLGACGYDDIAVALACPVVAKHKQRNELVVYGGGVHLSKDYVVNEAGIGIYGEVVGLKKNGWSVPFRNTYVKSLSQEHGIIRTTSEYFDALNIGDFVGILPVHSCLTVNLMREMYTLEEERIETMLK
nr:alanine racemase [Bacteroidota bacterium]